jgi:peptidoglycan/LPS O-acetylase OafA/YrhL
MQRRAGVGIIKFPANYHGLLGFTPGNYADDMVKIIGTTGLLPVLLLVIAARDPARNRGILLALIIISFALAGTYMYLVAGSQFPRRELFNAGLCLFSALALLALFPWKRSNRNVQPVSNKKPVRARRPSLTRHPH